LKIAITGIRGIPARYGGFETCAEETAVRFAREHEVIVYCRRHNSDHADSKFKGVNLIKLRSIHSKHFDTLSHTFLSILKIIADPGIQIVHVYNAVNSIFIPILRAFGKKVVVSVDGLEWKRRKWGKLARAFHKVSERICTRTADKIIADSTVVRDYYAREYNVKTEYIPYGGQVDSDADPGQLSEYGLTPRRYFLFVGRLVPEKGVHNLIAAYNKTDINMPLVIVGDDSSHEKYQKSLKEMATDRVRFLGFVYGRGYQAINKFPYVYVTSSMLEGTSPALVSAMGAGNCVLVNGIEENLATIGDAGLWYSENNTAELAEKLTILANNPAKVEEYRQKAYRHGQDNYNWDSIADQYISLFKNLLGEPESADHRCMEVSEGKRTLESIS